jgi:hypothetical protein
MSIQIKRFNWVNRPTRWQHAQAWASHRRQMVQKFMDEGAAASAAFANAQNALSSGVATLAAQASILRAQNQIAAARDKALASIDKLA